MIIASDPINSPESIYGEKIFRVPLCDVSIQLLGLCRGTKHPFLLLFGIVVIKLGEQIFGSIAEPMPSPEHF